MDLNKAMVDLYKQRSSATRSSLGKTRRSKVNDQNQPSKIIPLLPNDLANDSTDEPGGKKQRRLDDQQTVLSTINLRPKTTFDQLCGIEDVREQILKIVDRFKRSIENKAKKSDWPVLICGSHGLGKTALVEAAANHASLKLVPIPLQNLVEQTRNEFKESLEQLIRHCIANQPAIVLVDNLEQIIEKEEYKYLVRGTIRRLLDDQVKLLVFCTTSSTLDGMSDVDFLFTIQLKRPSFEARLKMLDNLSVQNTNLCDLTKDCLQVIAINTPSFTALDLKKVLDIAETNSDGRPRLHHCTEAIDVVRLSLKRGTHLIGEKPKVTWDDIGGMTEIRKEFEAIIKQTQGKRNCKYAGIALYGPPGCGKTMVAQAMANRQNIHFISIKPAELVDKFLGETEKNIRRVFHEAREYEPCMIYFDEFDGLCGTRGNKDTLTSAIQTLLSEMDGFVSRGKSMVLISTNRLGDIDGAMLRAGRLSKHFYIGPPDERARKEILNVITKKQWISLDDDVCLDEWARETDNFTGAELDFLIAEAESRASLNCDEPEDEVVTLKREHLEYAIKKIRASNRELDKKTKPTRSKTVID